MGVIQCPDCGNVVSEIAAACPHCGRPGPVRQPQGEPTIGDSAKRAGRFVWNFPTAIVLLPIVMAIVWFAAVILLETIQGIAENGLGGGGPATQAPWVNPVASSTTVVVGVGLLVLAMTRRSRQ